MKIVSGSTRMGFPHEISLSLLEAKLTNSYPVSRAACFTSSASCFTQYEQNFSSADDYRNAIQILESTTQPPFFPIQPRTFTVNNGGDEQGLEVGACAILQNIKLLNFPSIIKDVGGSVLPECIFQHCCFALKCSAAVDNSRTHSCCNLQPKTGNDMPHLLSVGM
jgi:hypothetical protein